MGRVGRKQLVIYGVMHACTIYRLITPKHIKNEPGELGELGAVIANVDLEKGVDVMDHLAERLNSMLNMES